MASTGAKVGAGVSAAVLLAAGGLIAKWEGVRYAPYKDAVGVLTVCYGHTGPDIVPGKEYTAQECKALLDADMRVANGEVRRCLPMPMLRQVEVALTSATFNIGMAATKSSGPWTSTTPVRACVTLADLASGPTRPAQSDSARSGDWKCLLPPPNPSRQPSNPHGPGRSG